MRTAIVSQNTLGRQVIVEKCLGTGSEDPSTTLLQNNKNKKKWLFNPAQGSINLPIQIELNKLKFQGTDSQNFSIKQTKKTDQFFIHSQLGILGIPG